MFLWTCFSVGCHSAAAVTVFLIIPYKDTYGRICRTLSESGKNIEISVFKAKWCILSRINDNVSFPVIIIVQLFFNFSVTQVDIDKENIKTLFLNLNNGCIFLSPFVCIWKICIPTMPINEFTIKFKGQLRSIYQISKVRLYEISISLAELFIPSYAWDTLK